jgi:hypothetical protein
MSLPLNLDPSNLGQNHSAKKHKGYEGWSRAEATYRGAST